jgi:serine/threonine protein kinase
MQLVGFILRMETGQKPFARIEVKSLVSFTVGTRLGVFEVSTLLGVGGMGEFYRARDTKLVREVAIKILPREFAHGRDRLTQFQREARLLAAGEYHV